MIVAALGLVLVTAVALALAPVPASAGEPSPVTVESAAHWGQGPAGAWAPYVVTVRNDGLDDIDGEVVLTPVREPDDPLEGDDDEPEAEQKLSVEDGAEVHDMSRDLDSSAILTTSPGGASAETENGRALWPTHRAPVSLPAGGEKTLTLLVVEAPFGYRAELHDQAGDVVAREGASTPTREGDGFRVAVLGRTGSGDILERGAATDQVASDLEVTAFDSARGFPDEALFLSGLQAVVMANFDSASLSEGQIRALRDYVALGGNLVLAGGATWQRTLGALPDELLPLPPSDTATAPLSALGTDDQAVDASASVTTGEQQFGTTVSAAGGRPLVIEARYGAGLIVQLAYDPFAEPFASDPALGALGLEAGLRPAFERVDFETGGTPAPNILWQTELNAPAEPDNLPWPPWPTWGVVLLGGYIVVFGPLTYLVIRGRRGRLRWATIPAAVVVLAGVMGFAQPTAREVPPYFDDAVEVHLLGAGGTSLVHGYHELIDRPDATDRAAGGDRARSFEPSQPAISSIVPVPDPEVGGGTAPASAGSVAPARAPAVAVADDGSPSLRLAPREDGELQTMQTLSIDREQGTLTASLEVTGTFEARDRRVSGTVTNGTGDRLRALAIQVGRDEARVSEIVEPGETVSLDVPIAPFDPVGDQEPGGVDALTAAGQFFLQYPKPEQVVLVARADDRRDSGTDGLVRTRQKLLVRILSIEAPPEG